MESVLLMVLQFNGPHAEKNRVELIKLMIHKCWLIVYFKFFTSSTIGTSQIGGSSSAVDHQIGILPPDASWIHDFEKPVRENSRLQAMYSTGIKLLEPDLKLWINFKKYFFIDGLGLLRTERSWGTSKDENSKIGWERERPRTANFLFSWDAEGRGRPRRGPGLVRGGPRTTIIESFRMRTGTETSEDVTFRKFLGRPRPSTFCGGLRRILNLKDVFVRRDLTQYL